MIADFDEDDDSDGYDLTSLMEELGRENCSQILPCQCDFNSDGKVDSIDLLFFSEDFGGIE